MTKSILLCLTLIMVIPCNAWGYIDPGTGSLLLQIIIAGIIGTIFTIKMYFKKIFTKKSIKGKLQNTEQISDVHKSDQFDVENLSKHCDEHNKGNDTSGKNNV